MPPREASDELLNRIEDLSTEELPVATKAFITLGDKESGLLENLAEHALLLRWQDVQPKHLTTYLAREWVPADQPPSDETLKLRLLHKHAKEALLPTIERQAETAQATLAAQTLTFLRPEAPGYPQLMRLAGYDERNAQRAHASSKVNEIRTLSQSDPVAALDAIAELLDHPDDLSQTLHLLPELANRQPAKAGRLAIEIAKRHPDMSYQIKAAVTPWTEIDPEAALAEIRGMPRFATRKMFYEASYNTWSASEPEAATKHAYNNIAAVGLRFDILPDLIGNWMAADPARASQYFEQLPLHAMSRYSSVYMPWLKQDPEAAMAHLCSISHDNLVIRSPGTTTFQILVEAWMKKNPMGALDWIEEQPAGRIKDHLLLASVDQLGSAYMERKLQLIGSMTNNHFRERAAKGMIEEMAKSDPLEALNALRTMPENLSESSLIMEGLFTTWAERDPAQALDMIQQLPENSPRGSLLEKLFEAWARSDPASAAAHFSLEIQGRARIQAAEEIAKSFYREAPESALTWLEEMPEDLQTEACTAITNQLRREGGVAAARFFDKLDNTGMKIADRTYQYIAYTWAETDPDSALEWSLGLPKARSNIRDKALHFTVYQTLQADPAKVASWIDNPELSSSDRDALRAGTSMHYDRLDPYVAARWLIDIVDPEKRVEPMKELKKSINKEQRSTLRQEISTDPDISPEKKTWLLDQL